MNVITSNTTSSFIVTPELIAHNTTFQMCKGFENVAIKFNLRNIIHSNLTTLNNVTFIGNIAPSYMIVTRVCPNILS